MTKTPVLRLPHNKSKWVWGLYRDFARCIVQVEVVQFDGHEWQVTTKCLPQIQGRDVGKATNNLDLFWKMVTPIGGRLEDLSNPISEKQYKKDG